MNQDIFDQMVVWQSPFILIKNKRTFAHILVMIQAVFTAIHCGTAGELNKKRGIQLLDNPLFNI